MTWWWVVLLMFVLLLAAIALPSPAEWLRHRARTRGLPARKRRRIKPLEADWVDERPQRTKPLDTRLLAGGGAAGGFGIGGDGDGADGGDSD
jgi:hypothetical protein